MTLVAPTLQAFFTDRLTRQLQASPRTIASYRDTLRLLLCFTQENTGKQPSKLDWSELNETVITAFLAHLETDRHEHASVIAQVLSIPPKRHQNRQISFLTAQESQALINAPDPSRWEGRRDQAMLTLTIQAGLRVSELIALNTGDIHLGTGAHVRCEGKGRKQRTVPLTLPAQTLLTAWLTERGGRPTDPLFVTRTGRRLSRDAIEQRVATHAAVAAAGCPSLEGKQLHPHVLRHSCAMSLLQAGVDTTVIALWLGHADVRSTQPYLHADLTIKEKALALVTPADVKPGRYRPADAVLAFLEGL